MGEDGYSGRQSFPAGFVKKKQNLLGKDLKLSHIVMESSERSIFNLLEIKVKRMEL